eukprot:TRINITY_DN1554_c0_g2_i3.p1 TRINITY_DN1554_c0_g2~~TRINITY_DN1554_c0_g2_i3.p1  ORF type:complete len:190 (-),score=21.78 TRINITY_DN1554_c0_g2_i3:1318-1887(-)
MLLHVASVVAIHLSASACTCANFCRLQAAIDMTSKPSAPLASICPPPSITGFVWRSLNNCFQEREVQLDAPWYMVDDIRAAITGPEADDDRLRVAILQAWTTWRSHTSGRELAPAETDAVPREEAMKFIRWLASNAASSSFNHEDSGGSSLDRLSGGGSDTIFLRGTQVSLQHSACLSIQQCTCACSAY